MNRVNIVGRLTKDIELKTTEKGTNVASFTVAVNETKEITNFINCVAWNQTAEFMSKYTKKGSLIGVDGRLSTRTYKDKQEKTVYVVEVIVDRIELYDKKVENENEDLKIDDDSYLPF